MARTAYAYAVGRSVGPADDAALQEITRQFVGGGSHLSELFYRVATSPAFATRCAD
jgi:hypothetical protein